MYHIVILIKDGILKRLIVINMNSQSCQCYQIKFFASDFEMAFRVYKNKFLLKL